MPDAVLRCSKNFPHPDGDQAVELLLVARVVGEDWTAKPRCADHSAAEDIRMLRKIDPTLKCAAVPLKATVEQMLREFHTTARQVGGGFRSAKMREDMLDEEVGELKEAVEASDLVKTADALADVVYTAVGTAVELDIPFDDVLAEVHRSNMTKLIPPIRTKPDGKIIKGPHYEPPRIADLLERR